MVPGPDHELFESQFFELVSKALRPGGVLCIQAESIWFQSLDIEELLTKLSKAPLMHGQLFIQQRFACHLLPKVLLIPKLRAPLNGRNVNRTDTCSHS
ncbi:hypothetical protein JHK85_010927 [Glycine max]|nr:hypothetical protein JHK85_010927 [Glycine max]